MIRVVIIGSGGVAETLARGVFRSTELELRQVYGRNRVRVEQISSEVGCTTSDELQDADIYIVSVSDRAIKGVCESINFPSEAIVVHTAGSVDMSVIEHTKRGVLYPLQSFTPGREVELSDVPFFVEGCSEEVTQRVEEVAEILSRSVLRMGSLRRKELHLCGVFASNFVNAIYAASATIAQRAEISFDLLKPLIRESCEKALSVADPRTVQTGPAVRGDEEVQARHLEMLCEDENLENIYKILSKQIWETSKKM